MKGREIISAVVARGTPPDWSAIAPQRSPRLAPYNATTPDWEPLVSAILVAGRPGTLIGDFMWMCENPQGVHQYKHCDTRNYAHLTGTETQEEAFTALAPAYNSAEKWNDQPVRTAAVREVANGR